MGGRVLTHVAIWDIIYIGTPNKQVLLSFIEELKTNKYFFIINIGTPEKQVFTFVLLGKNIGSTFL